MPGPPRLAALDDVRRLARGGLRRGRAAQHRGRSSSPSKRPADAEAMFDVLTYEKGAGVLRMLEQYLGEAVFRDGVRLYLKKHAYGNTETGDLWAGLAAASRAADRARSCTAGSSARATPSSRARLEGGDARADAAAVPYLARRTDDAGLWQVPVAASASATRRHGRTSLLLRARAPAGRAARRHGPSWSTTAATASTGCATSGSCWRACSPRCRRWPPIERFNLVNDAWASVLAGPDAAGGLPRPDGPLPRRARPERLVGADRRRSPRWIALIDDGDRPGLARLVRDRLGPTAAALGWQPEAGEDELTEPLRGDLLRGLGTLGDDGEVQAGRGGPPLRRGRGRPERAAPGHRGVPGPRRRRGALRRLPRAFQRAKTPQEEQRFLLALAGFRVPKPWSRGRWPLPRRRGADAGRPAPDAGACCVSTHSRAQAWAFFRSHWDELRGAAPAPGCGGCARA